MSITPTQPIPRPAIASWKLDALAARIYDQQITLIYGGYDTGGNRVAEKRFDLSADTTPSFSDMATACPAGPNFKRQLEAFGATLDSTLGGTVA